jgi:hypothetical protein
MKRQHLLILASSLFLGCYFSKQRNQIACTRAVQLDSIAGECPYFTKDTKGNPVLSWVRIINDSTTAFCYAINEGGNGFGKTRVIPNSSNIQPHGENLPKIVFRPDGEIMALWGARNVSAKNKYAGLIFYTHSPDGGQSWSDPKLLIDDTTSFDQRYYDLAILPDGEVGIVWLDNRKTTSEEGSALYFMKTNGSKGFEGSGRLISQRCCPCCRTDLYVDSKGNIHALYRAILQNSIRDLVHIVSTDGGKTFSSPERISPDNWVINGCPHTGPCMTENKQGIHFAWFTGGKERGAYYAKSADNGKTFSRKDSVSGAGSHPQITSTAGGDLLLAWDETISTEKNLIKRIGVQLRDADGDSQMKEFISDPYGCASFPVLSSIKEEVLVAYTESIEGKSFIAYQKLKIHSGAAGRDLAEELAK